MPGDNGFAKAATFLTALTAINLAAKWFPSEGTVDGLIRTTVGMGVNFLLRNLHEGSWTDMIIPRAGTNTWIGMFANANLLTGTDKAIYQASITIFGAISSGILPESTKNGNELYQRAVAALGL